MTGSSALAPFIQLTSSMFTVYMGNEGEAWWRTFVEQVTANIAKKMTFDDALLMREAECYQVEAIVTWNTKDFIRRSQLDVLTPTAFLQCLSRQ